MLCEGCSHRPVFETLHELDCIVAGDIGCYTLGVLPPFSAMDTGVCMGASIGVESEICATYCRKSRPNESSA